MHASRLGTRHVIRLLAVLVPVTFAVPALAIDAPDALGPWKVGHREASVVSPPHLPSGAT